MLIWGAVAAAILGPFAIAATSPLLAWRDPIYIVAGFSGVLAFGGLFLQPLLAGGYLPGLNTRLARRTHVWVGAAVVAAVAIHVIGLWITSPPDVIDALLFRSPTPFSAWGVIAMWAIFATALLGAFRQRLRLRPMIWRLVHLSMAGVIVVGSIVHAMLIEGTMEWVSKAGLSALVLGAALVVIIALRPWTVLTRKRA